MISKQDFLDMIQKQIFPILSLHQREMKWLAIFSLKRLILCLYILFPVFWFVFSTILDLIFNSDFNPVISGLLSISICIFIVLYLIHFSNNISNKIGKIIMPKIFSALNLEDHPETDKDYNFLENLPNYGFLPYFDIPFIFKSCILKKTYYDLLAQFLGLWVDTKKHSKRVFSGCLVSSKKICLLNSSLLILDKQLKYNPTQKELTKNYPIKSLEKGLRWKVIDCDNSWFSDNFTVYGINIYNSEVWHFYSKNSINKYSIARFAVKHILTIASYVLVNKNSSVGYKEIIDCGSIEKAKEKGLVRIEVKEYVVQDGDVVLFRFNV